MLNAKVMWACILIYLVAMLIVSKVVGSRQSKKEGSNSVFSAKLKWPVLVMTYIASLMSVWVFFAGPGGYYRGGLTYWFSEMTYFPMFVCAMYFSTNKVWIANKKRKYVTPSDFFYDRFKSKALRIVTGLIFLSASVPYVTSVMVSIGSAAETVTDGQMKYTHVILVIGIAMVLFTTIGGFKSVAWTDTVQGLVFMFCILAIGVLALIYCCDGSLITCFKTIHKNTGDSWFSYPGTYEWTPYAARFGYPFSCLIGYTIMLPHVFVRSAYTGDSLEAQRKVMTVTPLLQALVWTCTFIIGAIGIAAFPGMDSDVTEMIIPHIVRNVISPENATLGVIMMIMFFVGAAGVGISTADSFLLVGSSIFTNDFIGLVVGEKIDDKKKTWISRGVILAIGIISIIFALDPPELIYTLIMFAIAIVMPLFPILMYGIYWRRATKNAALISAIVGTVLVLLTYFVWDLGGLWYGAIGFVGTLVLMPVISLIDKPDDPKDSEAFFEALDEGHKEIFG